jgi:DNA-nicking Smr family endonuclease
MALRARKLTEADHVDWAHVARQIAPLPGRPRFLPVAAPAAEPAPPEPPARPVAVSVQPRPMPAPVVRAKPFSVSIGDEPAGLDKATWHRFRGGKLATSRRLDLHGMTTQHAFHALTAFLRTAHADHLRCVEVITGRGSPEKGGTIRRELPMWLNRPDIRPLILAASHPHAANTGSVRILLRRMR